MAMPASSQRLKYRGHQQQRHRSGADPGEGPPCLLGDEADPGEHEAGRGHQSEDDRQGPGVAE
jgi:hypothetical protein